MDYTRTNIRRVRKPRIDRSRVLILAGAFAVACAWAAVRYVTVYY